MLRCDVGIIKCNAESLHIRSVFLQLCYHSGNRFIHLYRVSNRAYGLHFQVVYAAIPHKGIFPDQILERGYISFAYQPVDTMTQGMIEMGKGSQALMAKGAAYSVIPGKRGVVKKLPSQGKYFRGKLIVLEPVIRFWKSFGYL